jgi:radical SAM additional 4Fe4S-binding domain
MDKLNIHTFEKMGKYLMFDIDTCEIREITSPAYQVLQLYSKKSDEEIVSQLSQEYSKEKIEEVLEELKVLEMDAASCKQNHIINALPSDFAKVNLTQIVLVISQECNLDCKYCNVNKGEYGQKGKMSVDTARKAVDYLMENSNEENNLVVSFFGGEPLLNFPVIKQTVEYIDQISRMYGKHIQMGITTNGTILNDEILDLLKRYKISVIVSIDGPKEIHDLWRKFKNGQGTHSAIEANIERMVKILPNAVSARVTITRQSPSFMEIGEYLEKMGFHDVQFSRVTEFKTCNNCSSKTYSDLALSEQDLLHVGEEFCQTGLSEIRNSDEKIKYSFRTGMLMRHMKNIKKRRPRRYNCGAGINTLGVGINGELYPCQYFIDMPVFKIGDVWNGLNINSLSSFYNNFNCNRQKCGACWAKNLCGRGCFFKAVKDYCRFDEPDEMECSIIQKFTEINLYLYAHLKNDIKRLI